MTTMAHPVERFAYRHHHPATTAALVAGFWVVAATLVAAAHVAIEPRWRVTGAVATIASVIVTAYAYSRVSARQATVTHTLGVGIAWLVLSIGTEIVLATQVGHGWFTLLGSPDRPLLRNVLLFVWIFTPSLFARREVADE
jgi:hypothetical protein